MTPALDGWLQRIHAGSQRLHRLVEQMIKMLQTGQFDRPLERRFVACADLVREAADDVRPFLQQRRQELGLDVSPDVGVIHVEPGKIRDCLDNLLLNAIKFTPDGGRIEVQARRDGDTITFGVRDSGIGIDPASLPHVFEPFFTQVDVSMHSWAVRVWPRGLGLGLSLARVFVQMHGGSLTVESTPGQGSIFTITLPQQEPPGKDAARLSIA